MYHIGYKMLNIQFNILFENRGSDAIDGWGVICVEMPKTVAEVGWTVLYFARPDVSLFDLVIHGLGLFQFIRVYIE